MNQRRARQHYRDFFVKAEFYYLSVADGLWGGAVRANQVPARVPNGAIKTGSLLDDAPWQTLYTAAHEARTWSGSEERV